MEEQTSNQFQQDFEFLFKVKAIVMEEVRKLRTDPETIKQFEKYNTNGMFMKMDRNKEIRVVFPQSLEATTARLGTNAGKSERMMFVGFVGFARPVEEIGQKLIDNVWGNDTELMGALKTHPDILCYSSAQTGFGKNWGNFVVFASMDALEHWKKCDAHYQSVRDLSPYYYTKVRIHRGVLPAGLPSSSFVLTRTLFIDYTKYPSDGTMDRYVKHWKKEGYTCSAISTLVTVE